MSEEKTPPPPPPPPTTTTPGTPRLRVRIPKEYSSSSSSSSNSSSSFSSLVKQWSPLPAIKQKLAWIPANWTWSKIKAALRCAVCAWVSGVVFVIPAVEVFLGNASFLLLIASVLSPPSDPFISVLERELLILLFVAVAWAWSCLGIKFADLARDFHDPTVNIRDAATGQFVEGGPSVILAVFLFLGSAFFLYIKARMGPGPYLFASIFACICLDIALTTAALFPFPFYLLGRTIILPLTIHTAISLLCSLLIFPSTMSTEYTGRLQNILLPIHSALSGHVDFFKERPGITSDEFGAAKKRIGDATIKSEAGLVPLAASSRLLSNDLVYGRFSPSDFRVFHALVRRLTGRAAGMKGYFDLVELSRERLMLGTPLQTPALSRVATPALSRRPSVDGPGEREGRGRGVKMDRRTDSVQSQRSGTGHISPTSPSSPRSRSHSRHRHVIPKHHHHVLHHSLLHLTLSRHGGHGSGGGGHGGYGGEGAVGTFESQRYMDLESVKFGERGAGGYIERQMTHLSTSSTPLLQSLTTSIKTIHTWLGNVGGSRGVRWWDFLNHHDKKSDSIVEDVRRAHSELTSVLEQFRNDTRHEVLTPYLPLFDPNPAPAEGVDVPPHHYLFHCYVYQYHLMQFAGVVGEMLEALLTLEKTRQRPRLWTPIRKLFKWNKYDVPENIENDDDEDPDVIQGLHPTSSDRAENDNESLDLGMPTQRDPDALPPRNAFEWVMTLLYHAASSFTHGNTLFAMKAGVFTVLLALPFFIRHSAEFAYKNRVVWAIIMGQLTIARFRGDTAFGLMARIISTFMGGVVGMVMWYISTGTGRGSPYGLAAVFLVCFPFFFYARLYWAVHPMINLIFFVTASLVVGYSYMDEHVLTPGSPGVGFSVAWKRFVLVTVGVFCAFIISFLPPSTTLRKYQRNLLATSSLELGAIYCSIISFANSHKEHEIQDIVTSLIAVRSKLKRSLVMKANVVYEFSLRGRWPAQRYQQVLDLQLQLSYSLSNLMSIMEHLEPTWTRAFLRRTRFMDPDFQGDVLAVFTMISSSLRTGEPLPQVTPSPLVHRFLARAHGLEVIHRESEEDYGLPRTLTLETLKNEQYLMFCVGVSVAFGIVNRLDKLMVATKEIVGEQYHIHGLGVRNTLDLGPRASASAAMGQFRPPRDV